MMKYSFGDCRYPVHFLNCVRKKVVMSTSSALRRLKQELASLSKETPEGMSASPIEDNLLKWQAMIFGPEGTPLEGGIFELSLDFPEEYPFKAPLVKFISDVFHPNVFSNGHICLDILRDRWTPTLDIRGLLISIQSLLVSPDLHQSPEGGANVEAETIYVNNRTEYNSRVRKLVQNQLDLFNTTAESSFSSN